MPDLYVAIDEQMRRGLSLKNEYFIADAIQLMIDDGKRVVAAPVTEWRDCGNEAALLDTNRYLLDAMPPAPAQTTNSVIIPPSYVSPAATIERSVIGPYASIGDRAVVQDAIVRDSIVDDDALIRSAHVAGSLVGRGATISGKPATLNVSDLSRVSL
jgi:glucose-1-phosphate thymidylyltransferase